MLLETKEYLKVDVFSFLIYFSLQNSHFSVLINLDSWDPKPSLSSWASAFAKTRLTLLFIL